MYVYYYLIFLGGVEDQMMKLFQECSSKNQQKWVIRIILKEMKFGLGHDSILAIIHPDAPLFYSNTNDLVKVSTYHQGCVVFFTWILYVIVYV